MATAADSGREADPGSLTRLVRQVSHTFCQNIRRRFRRSGFDRLFRRQLVQQNLLHRHLLRPRVQGRLGRFDSTFNRRHLITHAFSRFEYEGGTAGSQLFPHRFYFSGKLALEHIAGKLVLAVHHPYAPLLTDGKGRNPLRKLPVRQHIVKTAEAQRPKLC
ncbi:Uncharacterised protein [Neisseria meningitidis]|nr:Uncharacterised protein [Neisseria meningitidis]